MPTNMISVRDFKKDVTLVRIAAYDRYDRYGGDAQLQAVLRWLQGDNGTAGHGSWIMKEVGSIREIHMMLDDVNTAFACKMRWGV